MQRLYPLLTALTTLGLATALSAQLKDPLLSPVIHPDGTVDLALNARVFVGIRNATV